MPHDKFGNVLQVGDEVVVRFKVKALHGDDDNKSCNVNLESVEGMPEHGYKASLSAINTCQTEKVTI
jgi:hypothetical protein